MFQTEALPESASRYKSRSLEAHIESVKAPRGYVERLFVCWHVLRRLSARNGHWRNLKGFHVHQTVCDWRFDVSMIAYLHRDASWYLYVRQRTLALSGQLLRPLVSCKPMTLRHGALQRMDPRACIKSALYHEAGHRADSEVSWRLKGTPGFHPAVLEEVRRVVLFEQGYIDVSPIHLLSVDWDRRRSQNSLSPALRLRGIAMSQRYQGVRA